MTSIIAFYNILKNYKTIFYILLLLTLTLSTYLFINSKINKIKEKYINVGYNNAVNQLSKQYKERITLYNKTIDFLNKQNKQELEKKEAEYNKNILELKQKNINQKKELNKKIEQYKKLDNECKISQEYLDLLKFERLENE